jgi:hypothetical protein
LQKKSTTEIFSLI